MAPEPDATICWRGVIPSLTGGELCPLILSSQRKGEEFKLFFNQKNIGQK